MAILRGLAWIIGELDSDFLPNLNIFDSLDFGQSGPHNIFPTPSPNPPFIDTSNGPTSYFMFVRDGVGDVGKVLGDPDRKTRYVKRIRISRDTEKKYQETPI